MKLINYKHNIYSQHGEDGILKEIFKRINLKKENNWCVEFGAWDGKHLSNTFNLVEQGWNAVMIEGDPIKYNDLLKTCVDYPKIVPINAMVGFKVDDANNLDNLLYNTEIPKDFELLSIDIDSFDLAVWQRFSGKPKVVVIEINSSIKPGILQWHDGAHRQGNSFSSTIQVAKHKGYELVCHTGNLIFVRDDLIDLVGLDELSLTHPETLFLYDWVQGMQSKSLSLIIASKLPENLKRLIKRLVN